MPILFRYLLREYGKIFTMCFSGLMTIYLVIDFFEKVRRLLRYDATWLDVLVYFAFKPPAISFQIAPLAVLMATLLTFGLPLRGSMYNPVMVGGDAICRAGRCARRVLCVRCTSTHPPVPPI
jgi:hypothetical protein